MKKVKWITEKRRGGHQKALPFIYLSNHSPLYSAFYRFPVAEETTVPYDRHSKGDLTANTLLRNENDDQERHKKCKHMEGMYEKEYGTRTDDTSNRKDNY